MIPCHQSMIVVFEASIDASPMSTDSPLLTFLSLEPRLVLAEYTFINKKCIWVVLVGCFILAVKITWQRASDHIKICVILIIRISVIEDLNCWDSVIIWIGHDWVWYSHQLPRVLSHHSTLGFRPNTRRVIHATDTFIYCKHHVGGAQFQVWKSISVCHFSV